MIALYQLVDWFLWGVVIGIFVGLFLFVLYLMGQGK